MSRIRIIPTILVLLAVILVCSFASVALADDLVVGQTASWSTTHVFCARPNASATAQIEIHDLGYGPNGISETVKPKGAVRVAKVGTLFRRGSFFTLPASADVDSFAHLAFNDGRTHASYDVKPVKPITSEVFVGGIANDAEYVTTVNLWTETNTKVVIKTFDKEGAKVDEFTADVVPPVTQIPLRVFLPSGSVSVGPGAVICSPCPPLPPASGFVTVTAPDGGNAMVRELNPAQ